MPSPLLSPPRVVKEEGNSAYNFRWYTSYACPEEPLECVVTDTSTMEQYDLSRWAGVGLPWALAWVEGLQRSSRPCRGAYD